MRDKSELPKNTQAIRQMRSKLNTFLIKILPFDNTQATINLKDSALRMKNMDLVTRSNHGEPILKSNSQIVFESYRKEIKWALATMTFAIIALTIIDRFSLNSEDTRKLGLARVIFLIAPHLLATIIVFFKQSTQYLRLSFIIIMSSNIAMNIWHIWVGNDYVAHQVVLFSVAYLTLSTCIFAIIPSTTTIFTLGFLCSVLTLFIKSLSHFDAESNLLVGFTFVFTVLSLGFIAIIFSSFNTRVLKLSKKQSLQLENLASTEDLLNFALIETRQTIIFKDNTGIHQHPAQNEFTQFTRELDQEAILPTDLLLLLSRHGFQSNSIQDLTAEHTVNMRVLNDPSGKSYLTTMTVTPSGIQTVLLTDVTKIVRVGGLLNAALSGNKIGVSCYDDGGQLLMSRGSIPKEIPKELLNSFENIKQIIVQNSGGAQLAANCRFGNSYFDLSYMRYGDLNLITHVDVSSRIQIEAELRASHKMSLIGELTSGVAHDYNNILAILLSNLEIAKMHNTDNDVKEPIDNAIMSVHHAAEISKKLLSLAGQKALVSEVFDVSKSIQNMSSLIISALGNNIKLDFDLDENLNIMSNERDFQTAILNIIVNSKNAIGARKGLVTISSKRVGTHVSITVSDDGPGISQKIKSRVFEPFFTTKKNEHSTGLGLSMVKTFVDKSNGYISFLDVEKGALLALTFPEA